MENYLKNRMVTEGRAELMGGVAAKASERADKYNDAAEAVRENAEAAEQEYHQQRNEQYGNLAANAMTAFGSLIDAGGGSKLGARKALQVAQNSGKTKTGLPPSGVSKKDYEETRSIIGGYLK